MALIYLLGEEFENDKNLSLYYELLYRFKELGHKIIQEDLDLGQAVEFSFKKSIYSAEVIIAIISSSSLKNKNFYNEIVQVKNYTIHRDDKLFIPLVTGDVEFKILPESILNTKFLKLTDKYSSSEIDGLVRRIDESINLFLGRKIANDEKAQEIKEQIETTAPSYISETIKELNKREVYQRHIALSWYISGFVALISGIGVALWFSDNTLDIFKQNENWSLTVFYALKSIFIIVLLIASSKYSFNLAKSYMAESLKIADRIHAISFGKFYLQVFKDQINPVELKEIFRDWNINNQTNNLSNQSSADYDPMILEKFTDIIDKIKTLKN